MSVLASRLVASKWIEYGGTPCLEWTGRTNADGYGCAWFRGSWWYAHRVAFVQGVRELAKGEVVRHRCHNRRCCNPLHLLPGDVLANVRDQIEAGRFARKHTGRKLSPDDAAMIRFYLSGRGGSRTVRWCADRYSVARATIRAIRDGNAHKGAYPDEVKVAAFDPFDDENAGGRPQGVQA